MAGAWQATQTRMYDPEQTLDALVMTNAHVLRDAIQGTVDAAVTEVNCITCVCEI
jgi:hypothetical protein